jgi:hypothetical protein
VMKSGRTKSCRSWLGKLRQRCGKRTALQSRPSQGRG